MQSCDLLTQAAQCAPQVCHQSYVQGMHAAEQHVLSSFIQVAAPADGNVAAAAAAASLAKRSLTLTPSSAKPLTPADIISHLHGVMPKIRAAAAAASQQLPSAVDFHYSALKVTRAQQLQGPGSDRATRHVELQLPKGMTYSAGEGGGKGRSAG
jgi:sulfite reductase alpha subunit-like flavoprotein